MLPKPMKAGNGYYDTKRCFTDCRWQHSLSARRSVPPCKMASHPFGAYPHVPDYPFISIQWLAASFMRKGAYDEGS